MFLSVLMITKSNLLFLIPCLIYEHNRVVIILDGYSATFLD